MKYDSGSQNGRKRCKPHSVYDFLFCRKIVDVDKTMDEINEQTENMKQIQQALSTPIGAVADFDEVLSLITCNTS